ncbi:MAG: hypothetical protein A2667_02475 [Candidatus Wildermuthbacteria bacterium RIFCSPHIGHO2_01_FULL_47_27]|uniref:Uncharacterized protein n=1 Tax=Candidatus Wildermuthbacteria bacterium RIFCSPLOWO2_01_FULL_48_35 TaxID=1802463 RepID=A0A1G2RMQ8_9BACT|nr:MAG: hypothetical protein UY15_C0005G0024 [Parcubacteria group bacterium GW2011_GWA2_47_9]OHA63594.1 MAG: hypothetical protein A2667_02475 [Candidatus Wildermuthbacteria bacterium RIFCSPHIGHO2_01_FULL_47_27]OHA74130.1 MAG: hypothetical protein A3A32_00345 [Candidatus Wildermuthbacteria bacterium RIFCSPLOWO2_01_FULL_48_35]OHA75975.1 MAG: hypothetical protein A3I38_03010 [Candidatus Wildermuthbacteria bacterium RIFCSPLOWO2_02_FULL_47_10]
MPEEQDESPTGEDSEEGSAESSELPRENNSWASSLFSVEGAMMLTAALIIDGLGLIEAIPIIGSILSFLVDVCGVIIVGGWLLFFRGKGLQGSTGRGRSFVTRGMGKMFVRSTLMILEFVPVLGALPFWTALVLIELVGLND